VVDTELNDPLHGRHVQISGDHGRLFLRLRRFLVGIGCATCPETKLQLHLALNLHDLNAVHSKGKSEAQTWLKRVDEPAKSRQNAHAVSGYSCVTGEQCPEKHQGDRYSWNPTQVYVGQIEVGWR